MNRKTFLATLAGLLCIPRAKALEKKDATYWQPLRLTGENGSITVEVLARAVPESHEAKPRRVGLDSPNAIAYTVQHGAE